MATGTAAASRPHKSSGLRKSTGDWVYCEGAAALDDFIVSFAAWSERIFCDGLHYRFYPFLIGRGLILLGSDDKGRATLYGDGNGTGEGTVEDLVELLFRGVGGNDFQGLFFD